MADWRKKIREDGAKTRAAYTSSIAKAIYHSDVMSGLLLIGAALVALVAHLQGHGKKGDFIGLVVALPWALAAYRHNQTCNPCPYKGGS